MFGCILQGEDLDFAYGSISAFASRRTNQEAILGAEESIKEIKYVSAVKKFFYLIKRSFDHIVMGPSYNIFLHLLYQYLLFFYAYLILFLFCLLCVLLSVNPVASFVAYSGLFILTMDVWNLIYEY